MDYLSQLRGIHHQVTELGADIVAIGPKGAAQAQKIADRDFPFALLMDPEHTTREALGAPTFGAAQLLNPRGLWNYAKSVRAWRQFRFDIDFPVKMPAMAILDADQNVAWTHIGKIRGDYPSTDDLLARVADVVAGSGAVESEA